MLDESNDLCLVTEAWHHPRYPDNDDFLFLETIQDTKRSEGLILIGRIIRCCQLQALYPECWGKRYLLALIHIKRRDQSRPKRLMLHGTYTNPRAIPSSDENLNFLIRNIAIKFPDDATLLLGDFNRTRSRMHNLADLHLLKLLKPENLIGWHTWRKLNRSALGLLIRNRLESILPDQEEDEDSDIPEEISLRVQGSRSELNFILYNKNLSRNPTVEKLEGNIDSDNSVIYTHLPLSSLNDEEAHLITRYRTILNPDIS